MQPAKTETGFVPSNELRKLYQQSLQNFWKSAVIGDQTPQSLGGWIKHAFNTGVYKLLGHQSVDDEQADYRLANALYGGFMWYSNHHMADPVQKVSLDNEYLVSYTARGMGGVDEKDRKNLAVLALKEFVELVGDRKFINLLGINVSSEDGFIIIDNTDSEALKIRQRQNRQPV